MSHQIIETKYRSNSPLLFRCLKEEISTIRGEIRERKDRAEKLKIKYELVVKSLGCDGQKFGDEGQKAEKASTDLPSHAFQVLIHVQKYG